MGDDLVDRDALAAGRGGVDHDPQRNVGAVVEPHVSVLSVSPAVCTGPPGPGRNDAGL